MQLVCFDIYKNNQWNKVLLSDAKNSQKSHKYVVSNIYNLFY